MPTGTSSRVGGDYTYKSFTLGIAYNYILQEGRDKTSITTFNGVPAPLQADGRYNTPPKSSPRAWPTISDNKSRSYCKTLVCPKMSF